MRSHFVILFVGLFLCSTALTEPLRDWFPQRDDSEFEEVVVEMGPRLYRRARSRWHLNHQDTENLIQEVFLVFFQFPFGFDGKQGLFWWLEMVSVRIGTEGYRRERTLKRGRGVRTNVELGDVPEQGNPDHEGEFDVREIFDAFRSTVSADCASVLVLRAAGEPSFVIAAQLEMHPRKVQRLLQGAFERLRYLLQRQKSILCATVGFLGST